MFGGDSFTINSAGVATFGGAIGNGGASITALTINTAGPFALGQNTTVTNDITINVPDTAADTDDLTINNPAVITSTAGNILFNVGDDADIQALTAINAPGGTLTVNVDPIAGDADVGTGSTAIIAGAITTPNTFVNGGDDEDVFTPTPQPTTIFNIDGMQPVLPTLPGDILNLDAAGGAVTVTPGGVTIAGSTTNFVSIETLNLTNVGPITVNGDGTDNTLTLTGNGGTQDSGSMVLDAGPTINFSSAVPTSLVFNGMAGDDSFVIDETIAGLPILTGVAPGSHTNTAYVASGLTNAAGDQNVGIHFAGGPSSAALNDNLQMIFANPQNVATFDDVVGPAASGVANIAGVLSLSYDSLSPITVSGAGGTFTADASAIPGGANITVADDPADTAGAGGNQITSPNILFENRFINGFNNIVVRSGPGGNTITLNGMDPASTETAITLDTDDIFNTDASTDTVNVIGLPATVTATMLGGAGADDFFVSGFTGFALSQIFGQIIVSPPGDEAGGGDRLLATYVNDAGSTVQVNSTAIEGMTGFAGTPDIIYNTGDLIETIELFGSNGAVDTFNVQNTQSGSTYTIDTGVAGAFDDVVNISSDAPTNAGNLNGIQGQINIRIGSGANSAVNVSDAGDAAGDTYDLIFNGGTNATELYFNDGTAAVGTLGILSAGAAIPDIIYSNALTTPANFTLTGDSGSNNYNIYNTTATANNTITDSGTGGTFNIQGDNLQPGATNTFNGAAGTDTFNVNFAPGAATPGAAGTTFQINGGPLATSSARDVVFMQAAGTFTPGAPGAAPPTAIGIEAARTIGLTYADATKASGDLNVTDALTPTLLDLNQVETVTYLGATGNDVVNVTGTTADDDLTVAPYTTNNAFVFLDGDPWDGPSEGSQFDQFPGVAGGSAGPDLDIQGVAAGVGVGLNITGGGAGAAGDQLYVYAPSEADLTDAATTIDPFGFGVGVILPGSNNAAVPGLFPTAYDMINVADNTSIVTITNDRVVPGATPPSTPSVLLPIVPAAATFAQTNPLIPGLVINAGFETNPAFDGIGDDILAFLSTVLPIRINGGDPDPSNAPMGDRLQVFTFNEINVFSDKSTPPIVSVTSTISGTPTLPLSFSSIENTILTSGPGAQQVNLIGDNNDPTVDQNDNFVVVGRDVDSTLGSLAAVYPGSVIDPIFEPDPDGDNEFTLQINGSAPIGFRNVTDLNVFGDDRPNLATPGTPSAGPNDIDTLDITPYADDTPQGWGIDVAYDEGNPAGSDGAQADLLIYNTAFGGEVSEAIVIRPAGQDNGEIVVTNLGFGTPIVDIDFVANTDIIINDNDGFLNDTDTLTLLGTDPDNPGTSGNETINADFTAAGGVGTQQVIVQDGVNILYAVRNFTGFTSLDINPLGGDDALNFTPDTANANGLQNVVINYDGGDPVASDTLTVNALAGARVTQGADSTTGVVDQLGAGDVNYSNVEVANFNSATPDSTLIVGATNDNDTIALAPFSTQTRVWINDGPVVAANAASSNFSTVTLQGRFGNDSFSISPSDVAVNVDGGDPTSGSDTVVISGTAGNDTINFAADDRR